MTPTPPPAAPTPRRRAPGRAVRIANVPWDMYEGVLKAFEGKRNLKLTYDRGELEIMVPSQEHEKDGEFLARLVVILTEELGLPLQHGGSTTLKRKGMKKGLEPDKCFWVASAAKVAGVGKLNLKVHPPPDLAIEVDVTRSSLDRLGIYARIGVGELWRLDGDDLLFHALGTNKKYAPIAASGVFPGVAPGDLMPFVKQARTAANQNTPAAACRAWARHRATTMPVTDKE